MPSVISKFTGLVFGEGKGDKNFLIALIGLDKFKFHTRKWQFNFDNGKGCSAEDVLKECKKSIIGKSFDVVLCFIDLDDLKHKYPKSWMLQKGKLEREYSQIDIIWQIDKLEDELKKVIGNVSKSKGKLNRQAIRDIEKFINSDYYKKVLKVIKDRENEITE